jgi:peptidoglycan/xylan/chitin deacetylase (PgdA/CDA1 family)
MADVPILMYHALSAARTAGFHRWTLSAPRLRDHLAYLSSAGYRTVTVTDLLGRLRDGGPDPSDRVIALTFDDAYADFGEVALPLLARYRMTGTLFVPTGYVGGRSGWMRCDGEGDREILSWTALAEIAGQGIEIGAHSHTHPELDRVNPRALAGEASWPKAELEDRLGVPVSAFAYPYGRYDRRVRDAVAAAGYQTACTMNSWAASPASRALELPRIAVFHHMGPADLAQRLAASHDPARRTLLRAKRAAQSPARLLRSLTSRASSPLPPAEAA